MSRAASSPEPDSQRPLRALWFPLLEAQDPIAGASGLVLTALLPPELRASLLAALAAPAAPAAEPASLGAALAEQAFGYELLLWELARDTSVESFLALREALPLPVLVVCEGGEELGALLARLDRRDDIVLRSDPPELIVHRARRLAQHSPLAKDALTGLYSRRAFLTQLAARIEAAPAASLSVFSIDLDLFKHVNDTHGHAAGDAVLAEVAARLARVAPAGCALARVGGEELALLCPGGKDAALLLAESLRQAVRERPVALRDGSHVAITVSIGVAGGRAPSAEALLRAAKEAQVAAKARGRDRVVHLDQVEREALERDVPVQAAKLEDLTRVITERVAAVLTHHGRKLFQEIREQAELDGLTGLYSRRYFDQRLRAEIEVCRAQGRSLAVALLDVDRFGEVNKTHGWPAGDQVLVEISSRVAHSVRAEDWVARYGGEEIVIVLHGLGASHLSPVLERMRAAIAAAPVELRGGRSLTVTASIGAAVLRADDEDVAALMERVSVPLLAAKRDGRNRVCLAQ